jgi:hypothetical protein
MHDSHSHVTADSDAPADRGPGYETRDANVGPILKVAAGLAGLCAFAGFLVWFTMLGFTGGLPAPDLDLMTVPEPQGQLKALHDREDALLYTNGAAEKEGGPVRIKIERAIDLLAERGLPATPATKTEVEINSHSGTVAPPTTGKESKK